MFSLLCYLIDFYQFRKDPEEKIRKRLEEFYYWLLTNSLSATTAYMYKKMLRKFFRVTRAIYPNDRAILKFMTFLWQENMSKSHIRNYGNCLEWYYKFLGKEIKLPKPKKPGRVVREYLSKEEVSNILNHCESLRELSIYSKKAGIEKRVYPHLFRHSLATNMLNNGCDIFFIQKHLGHSRIDTTMIYLNSNNSAATSSLFNNVIAYLKNSNKMNLAKSGWEYFK